jgi:signal transduction histidine kinase
MLSFLNILFDFNYPNWYTQPMLENSKKTYVSGQSFSLQAAHPVSACIDSSFFEHTLSALPFALMIFDTGLKPLWSNSAAQNSPYPQFLASDIFTAQIRPAVEQVLQTGQACTFERVRIPELTSQVFTVTCSPLEDSYGSKFAVIVFSDCSETIKLEKQLAETEKLAALGKSSANIAHELNNPLDGILRYLSLAIRIIEDTRLDKPLEYLQQCRRGLMRMVQVTSELLEFSRGNYGRFEFTELTPIIEEAIRANALNARSQDVNVVTEFAPGSIKLRGGNLYHVFSNIIKNAFDAMPHGGTLIVSTAPSSQSWAVIEFKDSGPGIPAPNLDLIFEPFFTTKPPGQGTGLGLAICKDIVEKQGGTISAFNAAGGGCTFTVTLPLKA